MESINKAENEKLKLQKILSKPYQTDNRKEKVLFYLPELFYFVDSVSPLIFRYIQAEKEVIVAFPAVEDIVNKGYENIRKIEQIIEKLEMAGGECFCIQEQKLWSNEYSICFLCSGYSGILPAVLKENSRFVVSLQTSALYIDAYFNKGKFEEIFSEKVRNETDYVVTSEYIADWICERDICWHKKILRFGYPKLDVLYQALKSEVNIPKEWQQKIAGKKVYLFITWIVEMNDSWLNIFSDKEGDKIAIWRPHPQIMEIPEKRKRITEIAEKYNIIIDDNISYDIAFQVSDALVAPVNAGAIANYLYTGKPVCIYDREEMHRQAVIDYRRDVWYKSAYIVRKENEIGDFIKKVSVGDNFREKEQDLYRRHIVKHFDGKVCDRIYDYFEELKKQVNANVIL